MEATQHLHPPRSVPTIWYWPCMAVLLLVISFFCFYNLGQLPALDWDEARHGISGYEMLKEGKFLVNTYQYEPDYWNLKPPFSFWGVMLGYKLFGFSLFGMRFFSAMAFILTCVCIGLFTKNRYGAVESLCVLLLLACCSPFYRFHFACHADADALFAAFSVAAMLFLLMGADQPRYLPACAFSFACAFLTKSWHALFIVAVVGVYLLARRTLARLTLRQWLTFLGAGALPVLVWALLRARFDGITFFREMITVDLLNRATQVLENHSGSPLYYLRLCFRQSAVSGFLPLLIAFVYYSIAIQQPKPAAYRPAGRHKAEPPKPVFPDCPAFRRDLPGYLLWFFLPLFLFSAVQTKLSWYLIPLLFPVIILSGVLLGQILRACVRHIALWLLIWKWCCCALIFAVTIPAFLQVWQDIQPRYTDLLQNFLQSAAPLPDTKGQTVCLALNPAEVPEQGLQKYVLLGELYYDWKCKTASLQEGMADPDVALLLVSAGQASALSEDAGIERLAEQDGYVLLRKKA